MSKNEKRKIVCITFYIGATLWVCRLLTTIAITYTYEELGMSKFEAIVTSLSVGLVFLNIAWNGFFEKGGGN